MADKEANIAKKAAEQKAAKAKAKEKKPFFLIRWGKAIAKYCRDMKSELKKVTWPGHKQVIRNTLVVIAVVLVIGILIWIFDWLAAAVVKALINLVHV